MISLAPHALQYLGMFVWWLSAASGRPADLILNGCWCSLLVNAVKQMRVGPGYLLLWVPSAPLR